MQSKMSGCSLSTWLWLTSGPCVTEALELESQSQSHALHPLCFFTSALSYKSSNFTTIVTSQYTHHSVEGMSPDRLDICEHALE